MEGVAKATFKHRTPGERRRVELLAGQGDRPSVVIEFEVPDAISYARIEADSRRALDVLVRNPIALARYGFGDRGLTAEDAESLREIVFLIEAAVRLWKDWNVAFEGDEEGAGLSPPRIAELLHDPFMRAAWHVHLTNAAALDRAEGNAFASSPSTSSGGEANTAARAKSRKRPARGASRARPAASARA